MTQRRVGLWLIGAYGGVGATAALGLAALARGLTDTTSLVTALPLFEGLGLDEPAQFVLGGHDICVGQLLHQPRCRVAGVADRRRGEDEDAGVRAHDAILSGPPVLPCLRLRP